MPLLLSKVKKLEDYARDLSKEMSNLPPNPNLQKEMRQELLKLIMRDKFYPTKVEQFKDWPLIALKAEANRIERISYDPGMKRSAPDWSKYKKKIADLTLEYKRKKQELVTTKFGRAKAIEKWSRQYTNMVYAKLEKKRETDPTVPKKPAYRDKKVDEPQQQALSLKTLFTSSDTSIIALDHRKEQKQMEEEEKAQEADIMKMALQRMIEENTDSEKPQDLAKRVITRPPSPNSSKIKALPRNPLNSKILKWKSDQKTHALTLLKSSGEVKHISRENALGLCVADLQDLLKLQLCRDEDDEDSLNSELQFKWQTREMPMRQ
ncbi:hypothetical protein Hanom_Chr03g00180581 [Helianthus anomalus]